MFFMLPAGGAMSCESSVLSSKLYSYHVSSDRCLRGCDTQPLAQDSSPVCETRAVPQQHSGENETKHNFKPNSLCLCNAHNSTGIKILPEISIQICI